MKKIDMLLNQDQLIYGTSVELRKVRSRFNPFYYLFGPIKRKRFKPTEILLHRKG